MENSTRGRPIKTFQDLEVYQNLYKAMITVLTKIIPKLPKEERFDLVDQMRRASKAGSSLIFNFYFSLLFSNFQTAIF